MSLDEAKFKEAKKKGKKHYFALDSTYCPALRARVHFNSDGFYHMLFKNSRQKRNVGAQYSRIILIPLLKPVLKNAKRIHETRVESVKVAGVEKTRICYALVEDVGEELDAKVKVIVRKTGNGEYYFHSAMKLNRYAPKSKNTPEGV